MARRGFDESEGTVTEVGGIRIGQRRPPIWLLFVIAVVVAWGLYYLITYSVTTTGSFHKAPGAAAIFLRF